MHKIHVFGRVLMIFQGLRLLDSSHLFFDIYWVYCNIFNCNDNLKYIVLKTILRLVRLQYFLLLM